MKPRNLISILLITAALSSCAKEPLVKPYEREFLADPIMTFSRDPIADWQRAHVYETREAARGAGVSQGGGCGCN